MGRHTSKHKYLSVLVALTLMAGGVAEAQDHSVVSYNGQDVFDILYFDKADKGHWLENWRTDGTEILAYDFSSDIKNWVEMACRQWAEILYPGISSMKQPAQLMVRSTDSTTSAAAAGYYNYNEGDLEVTNNFKNIFQAGKEQPYIDFSSKESFDKLRHVGFGPIKISRYVGVDQNDGNYGWSGDVVGQLGQQELTVGLTSIMFHEIGHVLGLFAPISTNEKGNYGFFFDGNDPNTIENHLIDQNGNRAKDGQIIVSDLSLLDEDTQKDVNEHPENYFIITDNKAYFTGENVTKVLKGRTFEGKDGVPILGAEDGIPDLSHIDLERSLMSHQSYCSYKTFMEAELAVMQDLGYKIDLKNFYGRSIYNNDLNGEKAIKNTQGFFARNEVGTDYILGKANTATMGVGLHVYGSRNEITQTRDDDNEAGSADLLACGDGAAGIRIDGVENTVTLASDANIQANGINGVGILAAYGRDHQVNVKGNVSAMGEGGDAIRFDFGSNKNFEYRGSFIRYLWAIEEDKIISGWSIALKKQRDNNDTSSFSDCINGDLDSKMGSLRISGTVEGRNHAIYIAKNAFVDRIDIENGAKISGDIVSEWKHFGNIGNIYDGGWGEEKLGGKLLIQYGTKDDTAEG